MMLFLWHCSPGRGFMAPFLGTGGERAKASDGHCRCDGGSVADRIRKSRASEEGTESTHTKQNSEKEPLQHIETAS